MQTNLFKLNIFSIKVIYARIRREFYMTFRPRFVLRQIMTRKLDCDNCFDICCYKTNNLSMFYCKNIRFSRCFLHGKKDYPLNCFVFPLDKKDADIYGCKGVRWD